MKSFKRPGAAIVSKEEKVEKNYLAKLVFIVLICFSFFNIVIAADGTGGTITHESGYTIHSFLSGSDTFVPPAGVVEADVLVVAGGGGGGSDMGGGGGGGGVIYNPAYTVVGGNSYSVTVGGGGAGAYQGQGQLAGSNGENSVFDSLTALGGGGGASNHDGSGNPAGSGGSGGGASGGAQPPSGGETGGGGYGGGAPGTGTPGQGNDGSWGIWAWYPGGGGGAGASGSTNPAHGGVGVANSILGTEYYWGGGGGGSGYSDVGGNGGIGGGGGGAVGTTTGGAGLNSGSPGGGGNTNDQTNMPGGNAGANTGGGGGGGSHYNWNNYGGNGGSGIVIIRYLPPISFTGTTTASGANSQNWLFANFSFFNESDAFTFSIELYNSSGLVNSTTTERGINFTNLQGTFYLNITVTDSSDANFSTETRTISLDNVAPSASLTYPVNNSGSNSLNNNFTANTSDAGGLKNATLHIFYAGNNSEILFNIATTIIGDVSGGTATQGSYVGYGFFGSYGYSYDFYVYAYKNIEGVAVYSENPHVINFYDDNSQNSFDSIDLNWNAVEGADGYKIIIVRDDYNRAYSYSYNELWILWDGNHHYGTGVDGFYETTTGTSLSYHGYGDYYNYFGQQMIYEDPIVTTPSSPYNTDNAMNIYDFVSQGVTSAIFGIIVPLVEGTYNWYYTVFDWAGNSNTTSLNRFSIDLVNPVISNVQYSPNSSADIDPETLITISANITDGRTDISSAILQYYNGSSWANESMILISGTNLSGNYQANITTVATDTNYTFNIFTNDSANNVNVSSGINFSSYLDWTWDAYLDFNSAPGRYNQQKYIGNLTINNTGDYNLTFDYLNSNAPYGDKIIFDGLIFLPEFVLSSNKSFKDSRSISLNTTFGSVNTTNNVSVFVGAAESEAVPTLKTIYFDLVSYAGGPYLESEIDDFPESESINQSSNLSLGAYVSNIGDENAQNLSMNWSFPSVVVNLTGSIISEVVENLTSRSEGPSNYTIRSDLFVSVPPTLAAGTHTIYFYASASNGTDITPETNVTLSKTITVRCSQIDSVCGTGCSYITSDTNYDRDCSAPSTSTASAGGGGGGGGSGDLFGKSEAIFELVRGENQQFVLTLENKLDSPKRNISIKVSGTNSEYVSFVPKTIDYLAPKAKVDITVTITAPSYFSTDKNLLTFGFSGDIIANTTTRFTEQKFVTLRILDISRAEVEKMMNTSSDILSKMNQSGFITTAVKDLLSQIQSDYANYSFASLKELSSQVDLIYKSAIDSNKSMEEVRFNIDDAEKRGLTVSETKKLLYLAEILFKRGDYVLAAGKLKEAKLTFALETKGEFKILYAIKNNPGESAGIILSLFLIGIGSSYVIRLNLLRRKLRVLAEEEQLLLQLMKVIQRDCFENNRMSMEEYNEAMLQYEARLSEVIQERIRAETLLANLMKIKGEKNASKQEKERLLTLIKTAQEDYLNKGKLDTRIYENMLKTYSSRLSKIEEEMVFKEAQEEIRKVTGWQWPWNKK